ncbi:AEC family transporter [Ihubacter sp. rT4E-8]|uniref:AEC family transporter n=1 Tax=Ihubacter sp. rT4E-8 TaxID=3242369 RepID=UPI00137A1ABA
MLTMFLKVASIFCMVAVGFIANKKNILPMEANKYLVNLLLTITTPCMIIGSMASNTLTPDTLRQTMEVIVGSLLYFIIGAFISLGLTKLMRCPMENRGVLMVIITAVNTGFMGFPITKSIFGDDMFFLMVIENQILTIYLYFISVIQMNYGYKKGGSLKSIVKPLCNMCTLAAVIGFIILFGGVQLPPVALDFFNTIGDATIPVSMIVVGIQLGNSNLKKIIKNGQLILASLINVTLMPFLTFLAVHWLPLTNAGKLILVFAAAFPCAVVTVAVASKEGRNADLMAEGVALTTLFSMATLPIAALLLTHLYC